MLYIVFLLLILAVSTYGVEGYIVDRVVEIRYADGKREVRKIREFVSPEAVAGEEEIPGKGKVRGYILLIDEKGRKAYSVDHKKKQYLDFPFPEGKFSRMAEGLLHGGFINHGDLKCALSNYRLTGREEKAGSWEAKEATLPDDRIRVFLVKDEDLQKATLMYLEFHLKAVKKGGLWDAETIALCERAFQTFREAVREFGAPARIVRDLGDRLIIERVEKVERGDIPESTFRLPEGYRDAGLLFLEKAIEEEFR